MRLLFITSTPSNVSEGSGTFVGRSTLETALTSAGVTVEVVNPGLMFPVYTIRRIMFNEMLRHRRWGDYDAFVGFDMDGYSLRRTRTIPMIASIKGVIADELQFESGITRATMSVQAAFEKRNVSRADLVITTSNYSATRIQELYSVTPFPRVVPEAIDLAEWQELFRRNADVLCGGRFIVLCVCRFYPRKRLSLLLRVADRLRGRIPGLEIRIVGSGPDEGRLRDDWRRMRLENVVTWLGTISQNELAAEYKRCKVFCLPSVQEGFGIVFLEAMACGKPIVATRASAVPEVVKHGLLVGRDNEEQLADAIERLYKDPSLRDSLAAAGLEHVKRFDAPRVAREFVAQVEFSREQILTSDRLRRS
jgi:glycosyltransferase involved in cell wall biosynthesis